MYLFLLFFFSLCNIETHWLVLTTSTLFLSSSICGLPLNHPQTHTEFTDLQDDSYSNEADTSEIIITLVEGD